MLNTCWFCTSLQLKLLFHNRCKSFVGRQGNVQVVTIGEECSRVGHAAHELGHAFGLWHEHSRPDRNKYIDIHRENLEDDANWINFQQIAKEQFEQVPNVGYDIQSIMHYSPYAFSRPVGGEKTITIREDAELPELQCTNRLEMGQREQLSFKDKKRASLLYNCNCKLVFFLFW